MARVNYVQSGEYLQGKIYNHLIIRPQRNFHEIQHTPKSTGGCLNNYVLHSSMNSAFKEIPAFQSKNLDKI